MINYQVLYGSKATEFLDVAMDLRGSKLELVGVGYGEAFDSAREYLTRSLARVFVRFLGSAAGMSWRNKWRA